MADAIRNHKLIQPYRRKFPRTPEGHEFKNDIFIDDQKLTSIGLQFNSRFCFLVYCLFQFSTNLSSSAPREVHVPLPYCAILTSSSPLQKYITCNVETSETATWT
jgi:hypothetical protein